MRYAVLSDIHSNIEALEAVFTAADNAGVENFVCLGDLVGYNASPNECIDLLRDRSVRCILGNHDSRAAALEEPGNFNPYAMAAILWTREVLEKDNAEYLAALPRSLVTDDGFLMVHGWINDTDGYITTSADADSNLRVMEVQGIDLCFFGHTHIARAYAATEAGTSVLEPGHGSAFDISPYKRVLLNPGSVGQPRDADPRASFAVYDTENKEVRIHRVEYDVNSCRGRILKAGLSGALPASAAKFLSERLRHGR